MGNDPRMNCGKIFATINGVVRDFVQNDYEKLSNLPSINNVTLTGNLALKDLGISEIIFDYSNQLPDIGDDKCLYIDKMKIIKNLIKGEG